MADTDFVVEIKNSGVEAENSGTEELKFNSDSGVEAQNSGIEELKSNSDSGVEAQNFGTEELESNSDSGVEAQNSGIEELKSNSDSGVEAQNFGTEELESNSDSGIEAENSGTEELKSNSDSGWQESEWICKIRSGLERARSGQNAGGYVPIKKVPACFRKPVELYTPRQWQFGLHNRDPQASSNESEVVKIGYAAACNLNQDNWDKFCAEFVDNPADLKLKTYGIYSSVTELSLKEVQYLLTLDALTLVLLLSGAACAFERHNLNLVDQRLQLPTLFIEAVRSGGVNLSAFFTDRAASFGILDDLFLCENQIPMALVKKTISKCYALLPEERKCNNYPELRELEYPDSDVTRELLDRILKIVASYMCYRFFPHPYPREGPYLVELIDLNYKVGELEDCEHFFACVHKVMTSCVGQPPITTTFERAKQLFLRAVPTAPKKLANVIATFFGFSREIAIGDFFGVESLQSATVLKKAGLRIQGVPGMVKEVAFKNGCLFLPIMAQSARVESYICNMIMYELCNSADGFPFNNYILLMSHLIKTPEDMSYLIDCDVIRLVGGTQKRSFQMWQLLQVHLRKYADEYSENIVKPINRHCASALNMMITDFYGTYCSKPWLVISVISGIILLVATLIQTYVAVISSDKMLPHFPRGG